MEFARLGVSLALPLLCKDDLIGMLALGEKPSRVLFVPVVVAQHRCGGRAPACHPAGGPSPWRCAPWRAARTP